MSSPTILHKASVGTNAASTNATTRTMSYDHPGGWMVVFVHHSGTTSVTASCSFNGHTLPLLQKATATSPVAFLFAADVPAANHTITITFTGSVRRRAIAALSIGNTNGVRASNQMTMGSGSVLNHTTPGEGSDLRLGYLTMSHSVDAEQSGEGQTRELTDDHESRWVVDSKGDSSFQWTALNSSSSKAVIGVAMEAVPAGSASASLERTYPLFTSQKGTSLVPPPEPAQVSLSRTYPIFTSSKTAEVKDRTYRDVILGDGPAMYLRCDQISSGTTINELGGTVVVTTPRSVVTGKMGNAIRVGPSTGSSDGNIQPSISNLHTHLNGGGVFTVEAWIKPVEGGALLFNANDSAWANYMYLEYRGTNGNPYVVVGSWAYEMHFPCHLLDPTAWHHLVISLSTQPLSATVWIDGYSVPMGYTLGSTQTFPNTFTSQRINRYGGITEYDEIAFYTKALTTTQVQTHTLVGGGTIYTPPALHIWQMWDGTSWIPVSVVHF
jgi:hypothetical protein